MHNHNLEDIPGLMEQLWYGFQWDEQNATELLTPIGSTILHASDPICNAVYNAVVNSTTGAEVYKLSQYTKNLKSDGITPSVLTGADGDVIAVSPQFYLRYERDGTINKFKFSTYPLAGFTLIKSKRLACYNMYIDGNGKARSISGVTPTTNKYQSEFREAARLKNASSDRWSSMLLDQWQIFILLGMLKTKAFNFQRTVGDGAVNAQSTDWAAYNSSSPVILTGVGNHLGAATTYVPNVIPLFKGAVTTASATDRCIALGRFKKGSDGTYAIGRVDGQYPCVGMAIKNVTQGTQTTIKAWISDNEVSVNATGMFNTIGDVIECPLLAEQVMLFGIEGLWGHVWNDVQNVLCNYVTEVGVNYQRLYICGDENGWNCNPSLTADTLTTSYKYKGELPSASGYIRSLLPGLLLPATATGGGATTYMCDYHYAPAANVGVRGVRVGGYLYSGSVAGPLSALYSHAPGIRFANFAARLGLTL
jgi:hypothetical protein